MVLAVAAALDKGFNVLINSGPINGEAGSRLGPSDPLMSVMEAAEHCGPKACWNE